MDYKEILELIGRKDKLGLEALYNTYGQKFYSYAVQRWFLNEDEAWEVVYQTLDTLVLKLPGYDFESKLHFDNFLFKVFTNFLRQFFRRHRKHQFDKVDLDVNFSSESDPDDYHESDDEKTNFEIDSRSFNEYYQTDIVENPKLIALEKALMNLDETERNILLLRAQNYSYDEIASMLNIENNQLKVKHHRSKLKLTKMLIENSGSHE